MRNATLPELVCPLESYKFCERNSKSRTKFCVKFFLEILIEINFFNMFKPLIMYLLLVYYFKISLIVVSVAVASGCS